MTILFDNGSAAFISRNISEEQGQEVVDSSSRH
jgi:hypothetical protein